MLIVVGVVFDVFVYTQTLVDIGDLFVTISRHLPVLVGSLWLLLKLLFIVLNVKRY